jgi:hypothetical protein
MYLGQLNTAFSHSDSDIGLHIEEDADDSFSSSSSSSSSDLSANADHQQQRQQQQNGNISNGSLDRLTGVSTKGDGTSLHRQALSVTSIHCTDEPMDPPPSSPIPPWHHDDGLTMNDDTDRTYDLSPPPPPFPSNSSNNAAATNNNSSFILSYRSGKMAQQLCFIERDVLLGVDWEEMVHCRWTKMDAAAAAATTNESGTQNNSQHDDSCLSSLNDPINYTRQIRQMQLARQDGYGGIEQVIERFNTVCQWVASEIVSVQKLDLRVKVVEKFIRLAQVPRKRKKKEKLMLTFALHLSLLEMPYVFQLCNFGTDPSWPAIPFGVSTQKDVGPCQCQRTPPSRRTVPLYVAHAQLEAYPRQHDDGGRRIRHVPDRSASGDAWDEQGGIHQTHPSQDPFWRLHPLFGHLPVRSRLQLGATALPGTQPCPPQDLQGTNRIKPSKSVACIETTLGEL